MAVDSYDIEKIIRWSKRLDDLNKPKVEWYEMYENYRIDPYKVNMHDPTETFRFFILSMLYQGGADTQAKKLLEEIGLDTVANYDQMKNDILIGRRLCDRLKCYVFFQKCDFKKRQVPRCSGHYDDCPVKTIGNKIHHMKASELAKGIVSAVILISEKWNNDLNNIWREAKKFGGLKGSEFIIQELKWVRSVNEKIAHMFCAFMSNPDAEWKITAWKEGIDWAYFVVIDSLVMRELRRMGLASKEDYAGCAYALRTISEHIDLTKIFDDTYERYNPRIVELALWYHGRAKYGGPCSDKPSCTKCLIKDKCLKLL